MVENVMATIKAASQILPEVWPLQGNVAVNPFWDKISLSFEALITKIQQVMPVSGYLKANEYRDLIDKQEIQVETFKDQLSQYIRSHSNISASSNFESELNTLAQLLCGPNCLALLRAYEERQGYLEGFFLETLEKLETVESNVQKFLMTVFSSNAIAESKTDIFDSWLKYIKIKDKKRYDWIVKQDLKKDDWLNQIITSLQASVEEMQRLIEFLMARQIGWCGLVKWIEARPNHPLLSKNIALKDMLLITCLSLVTLKEPENSVLVKILESLNLIQNSKNQDTLYTLLKKHDEKWLNEFTQDLLEALKVTPIGAVYHCFQSAWEANYHQALLKNLAVNPKNNTPRQSYSAQFVFCMDTRSEPIRRQLEKLGNYQTFGTAGFFGCLFQIEDINNHGVSDQCPVIVQPKYKIEFEKTVSHKSHLLTQMQEGGAKTLDSHLGSFALFEMLGLISAKGLIAKNQLPKLLGSYQQDANANALSDFAKVLATLDERVDMPSIANDLAAFCLSIGLVDNIADTVFICGHGAEMQNNPFKTNYQCGACGGNPGDFNALVACHFLNHPKIRQSLTEKGIHIPENTRFIPAFHHTTKGTITLLDESHGEYVSSDILNDLEKACALALADTKKNLPCNQDIQTASCDWAEIIPEWALINNACLIIGPRQKTAGIDLAGRAFLHCYDPEKDTKGELLEAILCGPLVVAHWINMQYYFSSTDPNVLGSGNKLLHSVIPGVGVLEGDDTALKFGLPAQSLFFKGERLHEPRRLFVVVFGKQTYVDSILQKHSVLNNLFQNKWAFLHVIEPK